MSTSRRLLLIGVTLAGIAAAVTLSAQFLQMEARQRLAGVFETVAQPLAALEIARGRVALLEEQFIEVASRGDTGGMALPASDAANLVAQLTEIQSGLAQTSGAEQSASTQQAIEELLFSVSRLRATQGEVSWRLAVREIGDIGARFENAVRLMRADAYGSRLRADQSIAGAMRIGTLGLLALLLAGALLLGLFGRTLTRAIRAATRSLIEGDGQLVADTGGSLADLSRAISELNGRRAEERRLAQKDIALRTGSMEREIAVQRSRFEIAIENMGQGFALLDEKRTLTAANGAFRILFPQIGEGSTHEALARDPILSGLFGPNASLVASGEAAMGEIVEARRLGAPGGTTTIIVENVTERRATSRRIEELSGCDALTGLPNRTRFDERLEAALAKENLRGDMAVLCVEVNGFKAVNVNYGHAAGDALLRGTAERLAASLAPSDFLARIGGDTFAILRLVVRGGQDGETLAQDILARFEEPISVGDRYIETDISIGVAPVVQRSGRTPRDAGTVLQEGEMALAQVRRERSRYAVYSPAMRQKADERQQIEADLRNALSAGELELFYQPIVDVEAGRISGFEALMRWRHPKRGMVPPSIFISLAEEIDIIEEIGLFALRTACAHAARWPSDTTVSVNFSPCQFRSETIVADVAAALEDAGLAPHRLQIEVTESLFLDRGERTLADLTALRALGCTVSMDDFGTGYSSLGYLSRFPFDKIKIDQSFVRNLQKAENAAIVRAVIGLSAAMDMAVLAEGVETAEQYRQLREEGCREMQGYLFSRPRPVGDLPAMMIEIADKLTELSGTGVRAVSVA